MSIVKDSRYDGSNECHETYWMWCPILKQESRVTV